VLQRGDSIVNIGFLPEYILFPYNRRVKNNTRCRKYHNYTVEINEFD
jgi:hypothetical protein